MTDADGLETAEGARGAAPATRPSGPSVPPGPTVAGTSAPIAVRTLTDGGQTASEVADWLAGFVAEATSTLDIAVYDFALTAGTLAPLASALSAATARGVRVRLAHNLQYDRPIPVPPPSALEPDQLEALGVPLRAIPGIPDLMHHKYVVRDGAVVWTGSLNWTDDAWVREENVIAVVSSGPVASAFERDFEDLWTTGAVQGTGAFEPGRSARGRRDRPDVVLAGSGPPARPPDRRPRSAAPSAASASLRR